MAIGDFNKEKKLDVASVSGTPTISHAVPIKITSGDDSTTGTGEVVLDWTNISSKSDLAVYDENDNLLDYHFESFDATAKTAVIHVYRDWVRDGSTQCKIAYGSGSSDQSVAASTVFDKEKNNSNLVSGWLLNESSGDALDVTSNNNDGTVTGATQGATGIVDGAYDFDGIDDVVQVPHDSSLDIMAASPGKITISAWVKLDTVSGKQLIVFKRAGSYHWQAQYWLRNDDGYIHYAYRNAADNNNHRYETDSTQISANQWTHVAFTYIEGDGSSANMYVDGSLVSGSWPSGDDGNDAAKVANYDVYIGEWSDGDRNLDGNIDDLRIYDRALSSAEIQAKYDASKSTPDFFSQQAGQATNTPPDAPTNPSPSDGATEVSTTTSLSVDVSDSDGDSMDVGFYWDGGTLIETVTGVSSGGTATTSSLSLSYNTTYNWYAIADDSYETTQSNTWSFTTEKNVVSITALKSTISSSITQGSTEKIAGAAGLKTNINLVKEQGITDKIAGAIASKINYTFSALQSTGERIKDVVATKAGYAYSVLQASTEKIAGVTASKPTITFNSLLMAAGSYARAALTSFTLSSLQASTEKITNVIATKTSNTFSALQGAAASIKDVVATKASYSFSILQASAESVMPVAALKAKWVFESLQSAAEGVKSITVNKINLVWQVLQADLIPVTVVNALKTGFSFASSTAKRIVDLFDRNIVSIIKTDSNNINISKEDSDDTKIGG